MSGYSCRKRIRIMNLAAIVFTGVYITMIHTDTFMLTNNSKRNVSKGLNNSVILSSYNNSSLKVLVFPLSKAVYNKPSINLSALPLSEAFSNSTFYGDKRILKYRWYFKPRRRRVSPLDYNFSGGSSKRCTPTEHPDLVVLVMSLHHMHLQRQAIRDTWGSVSTLGTWPGIKQRFSIRVLFVIGISKNSSLNSAVDKEAEERGDLILAQFEDSYYNLTRKVLMGFKWIREFCSNARYVMKVDEDTYMNIPVLVKLMNDRKWDDRIYGPYFSRDTVKRVGKYKVSKQVYPVAVYPPHVKGNLYFMQTNVAMKLLAVSEHMPYVPMEDAYVTGILAKPFNVKHAAVPVHLYNLHKPASPCELATGKKMISQKIFYETLYEVWRRAKDPSLCLTINNKSAFF